MVRRLNVYCTIFLVCCVGILLIINIGIQYTDTANYHTTIKSRRNIKNIIKVEDGEETYTQQIPIVLKDGTHGSTDMDYISKVTNENHGRHNENKIHTNMQSETHSSVYIKKILEKARAKIKDELSNYNFSQSDVNDLEDLVMESGGQPLRNLVVSTWRSGSNFLGDLIANVFPSTYYTCEPLIMYGFKQFRTPKEISKALSVVKRMLNCNYIRLEDYFEFLKYLDGKWEQFNIHNVGRHRSTSIQYSQKCKNENKGELCYNAEVTSRLCKLYPFQSMKIVRLRLKHFEEILADKTLNVKVILLVRDPRGVMQSRLHRPNCMRSSDCNDPTLLCADMVSDYVAARRLLQQYPDKLVVMRFEEIALQLNITTDRILKFLKTQRIQAFDDFLQSHTNVDVAGPHSTSRVSRDVPYKWRTTLDFNYVNEIQMACSNAMNLWGYKMAHNETHMTSKNFNPIEDYTISK